MKTSHLSHEKAGLRHFPSGKFLPNPVIIAHLGRSKLQTSRADACDCDLAARCVGHSPGISERGVYFWMAERRGIARRTYEMEVGREQVAEPAANEVLLITSGDLRLSANQACWPAQKEMEEKLTAAF